MQSIIRPLSNNARSSDHGNENISQETIIPSFNKDPPITMEEALFLVEGNPDTYNIRGVYIVVNILSMIGFMLLLSTMFFFQDP